MSGGLPSDFGEIQRPNNPIEPANFTTPAPETDETVRDLAKGIVIPKGSRTKSPSKIIPKKEIPTVVTNYIQENSSQKIVEKYKKDTAAFVKIKLTSKNFNQKEFIKLFFEDEEENFQDKIEESDEEDFRLDLRKKMIRDCLNSIPNAERASIFGPLVPLLDEVLPCLNYELRIELLKTIEKFPKEERRDVVPQLRQLLKQLQTDRILEILKILQQIPANQRASFVRDTIAVSKNIPEFDPFYGLKALQSLANIPSEERMEVIANIKFLLINISEFDVRIRLLKAVHKIPQEERSDIINYATPLFKKITENNIKVVLIKNLYKIPREERSDVIKYAIPLFEKINENDNKIALLNILHEIPPEERSNIIEHAKPLYEKITGVDKAALLRTLNEIPPEERSNVIEHTTSLFEKITEGNEFAALLQNDFVELLQEVSYILKEKRGDKIAQAKHIFEQLPFTGISDILSAIGRFPSEQLDGIIADTTTFYTGLTKIEKYEIHSALNAVADVPIEERGDIFNKVKPLIRSTTKAIYRTHILDIVKDLPRGQRSSFIQQSIPLLDGISEKNISDLLKLVASIPQEERNERVENLRIALRGIPQIERDAFFELTISLRIFDDKILCELARIPKEEISEIIHSISLFDGISDKNRSKFIKLVASIPQKQRSGRIRDLGDALRKVPQIDRDVFFELAISLSFIEGISNQNSRKLVNLVASIPQEQRNVRVEDLRIALMGIPKIERDAFFERAISLNFCDDKILCALARIPNEKRAELITFIFQSINLQNLIEVRREDLYFFRTRNPWSSREIYRFLQGVVSIPIDIREDLLAQFSNALRSVSNPSQRSTLLEFIAGIGIPSHQIPTARARLTSILQNIPSILDSSGVDNVLNLVRRELEPIPEVVSFPNIHNVYHLEIAREDLKNQPREVLSNLCEQFTKYQATELKVTFLGEPGIDLGGLGRQFITELADGIKEKMNFSQRENGMYRPMLAMNNNRFMPLSDQDRKVYNDFGKLIMFCLNAQDYPLGMLFDNGIFAALLRIKNTYLESNFDKLVKDPTMFNEMFEIYAAMNSNNDLDNKSIKMMKECLKEYNDETSEQVLKDLFALVEEEEDISKLNINFDLIKIKKHFSLLQSELKKVIVEQHFYPNLAPFFEIVKGMKGAPFKTLNWTALQKMKPNEISEKLQGTVTREMILEKMVFSNNITPEKQNWIKNWVLKSDDSKIKQFLFAMTGAYAIGNKKLIINNINNYQVNFHTCHNLVDLPFDLFEEETLISALEWAMLSTKYTNV